MAAWAGFSDEDLRKLKHQTPDPADGDLGNNKNVRNVVKGRGQGAGRGKMPPRDRQGSARQPGQRYHIGTIPEAPAEPLSPDQMLSQPKRKPAPTPSQKQKPKPPQSSLGNIAEEEEKTVPGKEEIKDEKKHVKEEVVYEEPKVEAMGRELDEKEYISREMTNLETFRQHQKVIEEQNKRKREMLAAAIMQRKEKAKAEASKLTRIQKQLTQLDEMLHVDVSRIRDRIEDASREYMDAQKRYDHAEQEFIEAKMDLFKKQEQKEQLTEHLCTLIHQNEVRKAKKLVELMEKLDMEEEDKPDLSLPEIPQLMLFSSVQHPIRTPTSPTANKPEEVPGNKVEQVPGNKVNPSKNKDGEVAELSASPLGNESQNKDSSGESEPSVEKNVNAATTGEKVPETITNTSSQGLEGSQTGQTAETTGNQTPPAEPNSTSDVSKTDQNKNNTSLSACSVVQNQSSATVSYRLTV